ncbi:MAG: hypothetical protein GY696_02890 [Gammaproteobacteria bacterium]|nr:hypothetical protein [Gammaproteobacteria bacterium]
MLSYNQAGSRVRELRQEFPEFWPKEEGSDEAEGECSRVFRVTLSGAKTVPSLDSKLIEVKAAAPVPAPARDSDLLVFFPSEECQHRGYSIPDAIVELQPDRRTFTIEASNYGMWPCILRNNDVLGSLQYCEPAQRKLYDGKSSTDLMVNAVGAVGDGEKMSPAEHRAQVSTHLNISSEVASPEQINTLRELLLEYHDRFALSEHELGEAKGILHHVDTGNHPPHAEKL